MFQFTSEEVGMFVFGDLPLKIYLPYLIYLLYSPPPEKTYLL